MIFFNGIGLFFLLLSSALVSSAIIADEAISPSEKTFNSQSEWLVETHLHSGIGQFQDMQTPLSLDETMHIDGNQAFAESGSQSGLILGADVEILSPDTNVKWANRLHLVRMVNLSASENYTDSSFSRLSIETGIQWRNILPLLNWNLYTLAGYQNAFYSNTSTGHRLSSIYPKIELGGSVSENWSGSVWSQYGMKQDLKYDGGDGAKSLRNSSASVFAAGVKASYNMSKSSALSFGFAMENAEILIEDIDSYQEVGLTLLSLDEREKKFNLSTVSSTIGVLTQW